MTREMRNRIIIYSIAFALGCGMSAICFALCGASLALVFSGFFILTPILPAMVLAQSRAGDRLVVSAITLLGIVIIWLCALSMSQCMACAAVLIAYAVMLGGFALMLVRIRVSALFANAIVTIAGLAWLTWPVWLVPNLPGSHVNSIVNFLIRFHPLFAVNGVLNNFGDWAHWPIAYRDLTRLGQDIPFSLPASVVSTCAVHGLVGIACWILGKHRPWRSGFVPSPGTPGEG